ncbi:MAG: hypothetical protein ACYC7D_05415 [Nitrososphaerales archaeon]
MPPNLARATKMSSKISMSTNGKRSWRNPDSGPRTIASIASGIETSSLVKLATT